VTRISLGRAWAQVASLFNGEKTQLVAMQSRTIVSYRRWKIQWFCLFTLTMFYGASIFLQPPAIYAQPGQPEVRYDKTSNTIFVGKPYDAADLQEAPFVNNPSAPGAPKSIISIPVLAERLEDLGQGALLLEQGNQIWLLSANLSVGQDAQLDVLSTDLAELRLESRPVVSGTVSPLNYLRLIVDGGALVVNGVNVRSWNSSADAVDITYQDGRSYIAAIRGARMDVLNAELSYLGWGLGETTGISWRLKASNNNPSSGPVGQVRNSRFHHNYYGIYIKDTTSLNVEYNQVFDNVIYGMLLSNSTGVLIGRNEFYNNHGHGLLLSRACTETTVSGNKVHNNDWGGIALYRGADNNQVYDNNVYENGYQGVVLFQSSNNQVFDNIIDENGNYGVNINADYDSNDLYDGLAANNVIKGNTITASKLGICLTGRADRNQITNNTVTRNFDKGIVIQTGGNQITSNTISKSEWGIHIQGGDPIVYPPGFLPITPALERPGRKNTFVKNIVEENAQGIVIEQGDENIIGSTGANSIISNQGHGIYLSNTTDTLIAGNVISGNQINGVTVVGGTSIRNRISRNAITRNRKLGIYLQGGNLLLPAPTILGFSEEMFYGTAPMSSTVELYFDPDGEGAFYKGATRADVSGSWRFLLPEPLVASEGAATALAIDRESNTSMFSIPFESFQVGGNPIGGAEVVNIPLQGAVFFDCNDDLPDLSGDPGESGPSLFPKRTFLPLVFRKIVQTIIEIAGEG
jgi:parallel beta-helix repeat protein